MGLLRSLYTFNEASALIGSCQVDSTAVTPLMKLLIFSPQVDSFSVATVTKLHIESYLKDSVAVPPVTKPLIITTSCYVNRCFSKAANWVL